MTSVWSARQQHNLSSTEHIITAEKGDEEDVTSTISVPEDRMRNMFHDFASFQKFLKDNDSRRPLGEHHLLHFFDAISTKSESPFVECTKEALAKNWSSSLDTQQQQRGVTHLHMSDCGLGPWLSTYLLRRGQGLVELDLSWNKIGLGDEPMLDTSEKSGLIHFINELRVHPRLRSLNLSANKLNWKDICDVLQDLQHNSTLEHLSLAANVNNGTGRIYLNEMMNAITEVREQLSIRLLDLSQNCLDFSSLQRLPIALRERFMRSQETVTQSTEGAKEKARANFLSDVTEEEAQARTDFEARSREGKSIEIKRLCILNARLSPPEYDSEMLATFGDIQTANKKARVQMEMETSLNQVPLSCWGIMGRWNSDSPAIHFWDCVAARGSCSSTWGYVPPLRCTKEALFIVRKCLRKSGSAAFSYISHNILAHILLYLWEARTINFLPTFPVKGCSVAFTEKQVY